MYLLFMLLFSCPAYAYIDAGIGSMLVQGIVACLMFLPFYARKIIRFFRKKGQKND